LLALLSYGLGPTDVPDSECIGALEFNAEGGHQYLIKAIHGPEGLPITISVIEFKYGEQTCQESKNLGVTGESSVTSCGRPPIIEEDEVTNAPCEIDKQ